MDRPVSSNEGGPTARATAELSHDGGRIVVTLGGELDLTTHHVLSGAIDRARDAGTDDVVLDMRAVLFLGLAAGTAIFAGERALGRDGRRLGVRAPSAPARLVLDLCGRGDLIERHLRLVADRPVPSAPSAPSAPLPPSAPWRAP